MFSKQQQNLCIALAFKVITDPIRGKQIFIRIYSGTLNSGNTVYNSTTGEKFKLGKLLIPHAGTSQPVNILTAGQIDCLLALQSKTTYLLEIH